jgi:hypothetical protein
MEDMYGTEIRKHPIKNSPWDTILDFVLPVWPGCEAWASERIFEILQDGMFHPDRLVNLKNALEEAVKKSLDYAGELPDDLSIHFRVLNSGIVQAVRFPTAKGKAAFAPPGYGFFLVQMTEDASYAKQNSPRLGGANHGIWLYIYGEGGPAP